MSNSLDSHQAQHLVAPDLGQTVCISFQQMTPCLEVIKLEYSLRLKIKRYDWLLADTCPQEANHCALF